MDSLFASNTPSDFIEGVRRRLHIWESPEEPMLALAAQPDWCTLPPELGGGRAEVLETRLVDHCIVKQHAGACAVVSVAGDILVVACATCNQFFWIRERKTP